MRTSRFWVVGAALALAGVGCSEEPGLYLGGPAGPAAAIQVSDGRVDLAAGGSATIGARVVDAAGNTVAGVAPTVTSGSAAVAGATVGAADEQWTATVTVAGAGLGETALTLSASGLTTEVVVRVGPASVTIVRSDGGPAEVPSGGSAEYELKLWDLAGNALTTVPAEYPPPLVTSTNAARVSVARVEGEALKWTATGAQPGAVNLNVASNARAAQFGLPVTARTAVTVVPGTFGGTLSAATAAPGTVITATKAAGGPDFDADSKATLGTTAAYVDGFTATTVRFAVPAIGSTAASTLSLLDMGSAQIAQTTTFTPSKAAEDAYSPGNITNDCSDPATPIDYATARSAGNWVYMVHDRTAHGAAGCQNGGGGYDHYVLYTTGASAQTVTVTAEWRIAGDMDVIVCTTSYSSCPGAGFSGATNSEVVTNVALAANTSYWIIFSPWTAGTGTNNIRLRVQ